eukprot:TRINITY_DN41776_c0_g1_i1.p1 TRINITY_DN41776_c0_g1~~TRINITY_DN41776_c0_g1_i1.p1  ORF type:complete len:414 (-),score=60.20 TRINITY_DN41776_c0_g1_i1:114-1355(-)
MLEEVIQPGQCDQQCNEILRQSSVVRRCEFSDAEEVEVQRRRFLLEVRTLETRLKVGLLTVFSIVAVVSATRLPIGDLRHVLSALVVCGFTWQSFASVRLLRGSGEVSPQVLSMTSLRSNLIPLLVLLAGSTATAACFIESLWHTQTTLFGQELLILLCVGLVYLLLDLCILGTFACGRVSADLLETALGEQLDAELDLQNTSISRQLQGNVTCIERRTYGLAQALLLALLFAVPRLLRLVYPFELGMFSMTVGVTLLLLGVVFIEQPEPEFVSMFEEEWRIIRSAFCTVSGSFAIFIGVVLFQPKHEACQVGLLRGAILLSILCLIDVTSILTTIRYMRSVECNGNERIEFLSGLRTDATSPPLLGMDGSRTCGQTSHSHGGSLLPSLLTRGSSGTFQPKTTGIPTPSISCG